MCTLLANAQRKISPQRITGLPGQPRPMMLSGFLLPAKNL
jgi:hypothetical protein